MKINVTETLKNINGEDFLNDKKEPLLVRDVLVNATLQIVPDEDGSKKYYRYELANKINNKDQEEIEIEPEDATFLKKEVARIYTPMIVGVVWDVLRGK